MMRTSGPKLPILESPRLDFDFNPHISLVWKGPKPRKRGLLLNQGDGSDKYDFEEKINFDVFPALQGGPHNNHISALAIALKQVATPEYKAYMQQVKRNTQALAAALLRRNCRLVTGGTDNHMILWDLRNLGLTGLIGVGDQPLQHEEHMSLFVSILLLEIGNHNYIQEVY